MRICFTSDFHGHQPLYDQTRAWVHQLRPRVLILGGDMCPDGAEPRPDRHQEAWFDEVLTQHLKALRAASPDTEIALLLGNHDWATTRRAACRAEQQGLLRLLEHDRVWQCDGVSFLGLHLCPPSPFWLKDFERLDTADAEVPSGRGRVWNPAADAPQEVDIADYLRSQRTLEDELATVHPPADPWILVAHAPPSDCKLDYLPVVSRGVGSRAIRRFIEQRRPRCALHGHVHESPLATGSHREELGGVLCVNPGQSPDRLHGVWFDSDDPQGTLRHTTFG